MKCRCGAEAPEGKTSCNRCEFYNSVFNPSAPMFESKRDLALRAMSAKKIIKQAYKIMVIE